MVMQSTKAEIGQKKKSEPNCNHHVMSGCSVCVRSRFLSEAAFLQ